MRLIGNVQGPLRRLGLDERITAFHHTFDQEGISPGDLALSLDRIPRLLSLISEAGS